MPIVSVEIMKIIDQRKRCDARCVVMWWSKYSTKKVVMRFSKFVMCHNEMKYLTAKVIVTNEELQLTYIHS